MLAHSTRSALQDSARPPEAGHRAPCSTRSAHDMRPALVAPPAALRWRPPLARRTTRRLPPKGRALAAAAGSALVCRRAKRPELDYAALPPPESSWVLVTGAATGLGWKLAQAAASAGFGLILTDQSSNLQMPATNELQMAGRSCPKQVN